ncbi:putative membrane protein [Erwinia amylovora ATCC 49946]|nr:putative membrane protein [Erwinia amylovora ATCC 49946]
MLRVQWLVQWLVARLEARWLNLAWIWYFNIMLIKMILHYRPFIVMTIGVISFISSIIWYGFNRKKHYTLLPLLQKEYSPGTLFISLSQVFFGLHPLYIYS